MPPFRGSTRPLAILPLLIAPAIAASTVLSPGQPAAAQSLFGNQRQPPVQHLSPKATDTCRTPTAPSPGAGYSQVLEEFIDGALAVAYTLGVDVVSQAKVGVQNEAALYMLYDAHGSTRALLDKLAAVIETYAYDAYGNALGFDPATALTTLLYSGEQFDPKLAMQYLRARYYDPAVGRFNRHDPFMGLLTDPQSLHRWLYTFADPTNRIDPSGAITLSEISITMFNVVRIATYAFRAVATALTAANFITTALELAQFLGSGGLARVRTQIQTVMNVWGRIPNTSATARLLDSQFWLEATEVLFSEAFTLVSRVINHRGQTIINKFAQRKKDPFVWLIYMPTPDQHDRMLANPEFRVPLPTLRFGFHKVPVAMQFGGGSAKGRYRGRLFGFGIRNLKSRRSEQYFRMDYHDPHDKMLTREKDRYYWEAEGKRYTFHFHIPLRG